MIGLYVDGAEVQGGCVKYHDDFLCTRLRRAIKRLCTLASCTPDKFPNSSSGIRMPDRTTVGCLKKNMDVINFLPSEARLSTSDNGISIIYYNHS